MLEAISAMKTVFIGVLRNAFLSFQTQSDAFISMLEALPCTDCHLALLSQIQSPFQWTAVPNAWRDPPVDSQLRYQPGLSTRGHSCGIVKPSLAGNAREPGNLAGNTGPFDNINNYRMANPRGKEVLRPISGRGFVRFATRQLSGYLAPMALEAGPLQPEH